MSTRTDSHTVEYHDDGTWTETVVNHGRPATAAEKRQAWIALGGLTALSLSPIAVMVLVEKWEDRKEKKRQAKLKSV